MAIKTLLYYLIYNNVLLGCHMQKLLSNLLSKESKLAVIGLGYVGMPLATAFAKKLDVIGYDSNNQKLESYKRGINPEHVVDDDDLKTTTVQFSSDKKILSQADVFIIAVPTPIDVNKAPDLIPVITASVTVGQALKKGSVVIYESTVYPGVTEDVCIPILEKESGLQCGADFKIGYSPERINPGDQVHKLANIKKIVSGIDEETTDFIAALYEMVVEVGVHRAPSIKVAEAAKVVENSQRDINIAFMNELAMVFERLNIDTLDVIEAMNTKWNALGFYPGLVGGHCIGIDPYYFIFEAEKNGYISKIILSGRKINDEMGSFIGQMIIKQLVLANKQVRQSKVYILGFTYKENCADIRNTKVMDIVKKLNEFGIDPVVVDPQADPAAALREYGVKLASLDDISDADCLVFAVAHNEFKNLSVEEIASMFIAGESDQKVIIDVKSMLEKKALTEEGYRYWRL